MFKVPSLGPGCAHFRTCSTCLKAPRFMNCGWCSGVCSSQLQCEMQWKKDSCAPVITEVHFRYRPPANRTGPSVVTMMTLSSSVFPQSGAGWWAHGDDAVWVGVPVFAATCHHQRQNTQHHGGSHCLCCPAEEEQQREVRTCTRTNTHAHTCSKCVHKRFPCPHICCIFLLQTGV